MFQGYHKRCYSKFAHVTRIEGLKNDSHMGLSCYDSCICTGCQNSTADSEILGNVSDSDSQDDTCIVTLVTNQIVC